MTTPIWSPGQLYLPGDLVRPVSAAPNTAATLTNGDFETGTASGWTLPAGCTVVSGSAFAGTYRAQFTGTAGAIRAVNTAAAVKPGQVVTANAMFQRGLDTNDDNPGRTVLVWYTAGMVELTAAESLGNILGSGVGSAYRQSSVTGTAPATAAFVAVGFRTTRNKAASSSIDQFVWDLIAPPTTSGLVYQAIQTAPGTSAATEPTWPVVLGTTVVDGGVTWQAGNNNRVTWQAAPILKTGATEPAWPTIPGAFVSDGTVSWECVSRRIEDKNCPNTKVVAIGASKVYAVDKDIIRFCATANPLDWTTELDAGYLPSGLRQANANNMAVLNLYRANLVAWNASSFQNWQIDPDPAAMAILDQMDGIGSTWQQAAQPVANDLLFLSALGVRSVGIAVGAQNLSSGDIGIPIDVLVQGALLAGGSTNKPIATYYPGLGQYWLAMASNPLPSAVSITGHLPSGVGGASGTYQYTVTGGRIPRTVSLLSGSLPPGATLAGSGLVTYAYSAAGVFSWVVRVTDADGLYADLADSATITLTNPAAVAWDPAQTGVDSTLSNRNLTLTGTGAGAISQTRCTLGRSTGKWYFEVSIKGQRPGFVSTNHEFLIGVTTVAGGSGTGNFDWSSDNVGQANHAGNVVNGNPQFNTIGDIVQVAIDIDNHLMWWGVNGTFVGNPAAGTGALISPTFLPWSGLVYPLANLNGQTATPQDVVTANFGELSLAYTPPTGFTRWVG